MYGFVLHHVDKGGRCSFARVHSAHAHTAYTSTLFVLGSGCGFSLHLDMKRVGGVTVTGWLLLASAAVIAAKPPNMVFMLMDDVSYNIPAHGDAIAS